MYYLFDTNILLFYLRGNPVCRQIDLTYDPFGATNTAMLSAVSVGEIKSIAVQNDWGRAKWVRLRELIWRAFLQSILAYNILIVNELFKKSDLIFK